MMYTRTYTSTHKMPIRKFINRVFSPVSNKMTHLGIVTLTEISKVVEVVTVTQTDDHYLKDYIPFVRLKVNGRLSPEDLKIIQGQKGMVVLDIECCVPTCPGDAGNLGPGPEDKIHTYVSLTPVNEAFERKQITAWVDFLRDKITK